MKTCPISPQPTTGNSAIAFPRHSNFSFTLNPVSTLVLSVIAIAGCILLYLANRSKPNNPPEQKPAPAPARFPTATCTPSYPSSADLALHEQIEADIKPQIAKQLGFVSTIPQGLAQARRRSATIPAQVLRVLGKWKKGHLPCFSARLLDMLTTGRVQAQWQDKALLYITSPLMVTTQIGKVLLKRRCPKSFDKEELKKDLIKELTTDPAGPYFGYNPHQLNLEDLDTIDEKVTFTLTVKNFVTVAMQKAHKENLDIPLYSFTHGGRTAHLRLFSTDYLIGSNKLQDYLVSWSDPFENDAKLMKLVMRRTTRQSPWYPHTYEISMGTRFPEQITQQWLEEHEFRNLEDAFCIPGYVEGKQVEFGAMSRFFEGTRKDVYKLMHSQNSCISYIQPSDIDLNNVQFRKTGGFITEIMDQLKEGYFGPGWSITLQPL